MGSYQLEHRIGSGGMGEVWRARHRMLARPAAIKLIHANALGSEKNESAARTALRRFEREAQATAALTSPHTVELYDFGITDDGTFYYVMELMEGMDLKSLVASAGPVPPGRAVHFLRQACRSLADAHRHGMIHRDIKPANLFTCRRGLEYDFIKVLDFGLVKETGVDDHDRTQLTMDGLASGTPAFMAPEMVSGEFDERIDLYALGCVAYWLLSGQLVFEGRTPMAIVLKHAQESAPLVSTRTELDIPGALDRIVADCLAKNPRDRPRSAVELSDRLAEVESEIAPWTPSLAEKWWRTHLPALAIDGPAAPRPVTAA